MPTIPVLFASLVATLASGQAVPETQNPAEPKMMAVAVFDGEQLIGRGLCVARRLESEGQAERYFYSHTSKLGPGGGVISVGEVHAWWSADGKPIRAIYKGTSPGQGLRAEAIFSEGSIVLTMSNATGRRTASSRQEIPLPRNSMVLFSPFDPMLLEEKLDKRDKKFFLLEPFGGGLFEYASTYRGSRPYSGIEGHIFEVVSGKRRAMTMCHETEGFVRTDQSDGGSIVRRPLTDADAAFLMEKALNPGAGA